MARPLRIQYPGALYHVTARGNERRPIFKDDVDRALWLTLLAGVASRHRLQVFAYVMMRNHYHLLLETGEPNLAQAMRQLNGVYTQTFNRRHRRVGHLFQGRYHAVLVDKTTYLLELTRYIHLNPVRVGEVGEASSFPWSSAAAYLGQRSPPPFLCVDEVLAVFSRSRAVAQELYRTFLQDGKSHSAGRPWDRVVGQTLLGPKEFVSRHREALRDRPDDIHVPALRQLRLRPSLSSVLEAVSSASGAEIAEITRRRSLRGGWPRLAGIYLGAQVCGLDYSILSREFGVTPFAIGKALVRAKERLWKEPEFLKILARFADPPTSPSDENRDSAVSSVEAVPSSFV